VRNNDWLGHSQNNRLPRLEPKGFMLFRECPNLKVLHDVKFVWWKPMKHSMNTQHKSTSTLMKKHNHQWRTKTPSHLSRRILHFIKPIHYSVKKWQKDYTYKHSFCNTSFDIHQCWNIIHVHRKKTWLTIKFIISCFVCHYSNKLHIWSTPSINTLLTLLCL